MITQLKKLLPEKAEKAFYGYKIAEIAFLIITIITIIRSLIHFLTPDGGAGSIATIDLNLEGSSIIVGIFALWGISQLLMGIIFCIVYFRYKNLIPFMYLLIIIEYTMRIFVGIIKPFETVGIAPGAIGNYVMIPLAAIMFFLSILKLKRKI
ncbi:MAG: hypothetical protein ACFFKA_16985 [Candidatus Thorarchaeota archaeon]